jgi:anti-sigma regulatory factor (Ser/Thr protein kinase)
MNAATRLISIDDPSSVGAARREATSVAAMLDFDATVTGRLAIAVTEVASNIIKHAIRGKLAIRVIGGQGAAAEADRTPAGMEIIAFDKGPGIANIGKSLNDGYSTAGSPGTGLGAIRRMTESFELYSQPGKGTAARFEVWQQALPARAPPVLLHGGLRVAMPGEVECGDDWMFASSGDRHTLFVADGLGHGPEAALAAQSAVSAAAAASQGQVSPAELIDAVHSALRHTRGAAAAVAVIEPAKQLCTFCGVGNIGASIFTAGQSRSLVSQNGILGHQAQHIQPFTYPILPGGLCIAHSDGLTAQWDLGAYPGLQARHPALIAAVLFRDHYRGRDDATVVAVRIPGGQ